MVGGGLYAGRRHKDARRFVRRHRRSLARRPLWLFSSGARHLGIGAGHPARARCAAHHDEASGST
ncbi:hypothetical protein ABZV31_26600 [Streptomyces sp. NPDC005202]|uniref:hypothetical protein n=1 Tax=Streptomyces sp. NPDC005202 TaxID=3157021 RepID=UPI00339F86E6